MRRGPRKSEFESEFLRGRAWCWGVTYASGFLSPAELEYAVSPETFKQRPYPPGGYSYPCIFRKIRNGERLTNIKLVNKTNVKFPGTSYWYTHPFWDVIREPDNVPSTHPEFAKQLTSKYAKAIFDPPKNIEKTGLFESCVTAVFRGLRQSGDLDSLTTAIYLIKQIRKNDPNDSETLDYLSETIIQIYIRVAACLPMWNISFDLLAYLNKYFLVFTENNPRKHEIQSGEVGVLVAFNRLRLNFIDDIEILKTHTYPLADCLEIIEHHVDPVFTGISESDTNKNINNITKIIQLVTKHLTE